MVQFNRYTDDVPISLAASMDKKAMDILQEKKGCRIFGLIRKSGFATYYMPRYTKGGITPDKAAANKKQAWQ